MNFISLHIQDEAGSLRYEECDGKSLKKTLSLMLNVAHALASTIALFSCRRLPIHIETPRKTTLEIITLATVTEITFKIHKVSLFR